MQTNYSTFLNYRAAQRRLAAKVARPHWLLLHVLTFVVTMTVIWPMAQAIDCGSTATILFCPHW